MLRIEIRQIFQTNGLIDDVVMYGEPEDYLHFSVEVSNAISSSDVVLLKSDSGICIEISKNSKYKDLFTSLQNASGEYFSMRDWDGRSILRVIGSRKVLGELSIFLSELSERGEGYSYISGYSKSRKYSRYSPEWRLHVEVP